MRIDPDLVAMAIVTAVMVLPGVGLSMYLRAKAAEWTRPVPRAQLLRLRQRRL